VRIVSLVSALAAVLGVLTSGAAFGGPPGNLVGPNSPTIVFVSPPSPSEGATLTTNSVQFTFTYNRKVSQTQSLLCTLQGPTSQVAACDTPIGTALPNWSQSGKSYSGLANGAYTMNVQLFLTDGGMTQAARRFTINRAPEPPKPTTLTTQAVPQGLQAGAQGHDTAALTGGNAGSAGGTVTYTLYSDAGCTQAVPGAGGQVTVSGGSVPNSADFTFTSAGTFHWQASYSGDALNQPSVSVCNDPAETVTVTAPSPEPTTLTTHAVPQSLRVGGQGHDTATLAGANAGSAGGTVTYVLYSDAGCTQTVPGAGSQVTVAAGSVPDSADFTFTTAGTFHWQASYSGDALNQPSASLCNEATETVTVMPTATAVVSRIAAGDFHTCALTSAGGVKCWGSNLYGQLGNGPNPDSNVPVDVSGLASGVTAVAAGGYHSCALTDAGAVKCWGRNDLGQLGNGANANSNVPVQVSGLASGVIAITGGDFHTCALTSAGGVKCWGDNGNGALGDGTGADSNIPVDVSGLASGVDAIAAGGYHTCALTSAGGVKCWGDNIYGQLGDGTTSSNGEPVEVVGLTSGVTAITGGYYHSCALTSAVGPKCWGRNNFGQLGNAGNANSSVPVDVSGLPAGADAIAVGGYHSCALTSSGGVKCWGAGGDGALGDGTNIDRNVPADVSGLTSGVSAIASGAYHSCALMSAGGIKCWGDNTGGQLGDGTNNSSNVPVDVMP
jgi:alpha-tubulin suppressor-like RCC1 family protein